MPIVDDDDLVGKFAARLTGRDDGAVFWGM
jgi:hypothetical protein